MDNRIVENAQIQPVIAPADLSLAANNGAWVNMADFEHLAFITTLSAPATTGNTCIITVQQAVDVSGTSAKALNFTDVYVKDGADITAVGQFAKVTQAAANTYTATATTDVHPKVVDIEFHAPELDIDNGFTCARVTIADVGANAQIGGVVAALTGPRFAGKPGAVPSAIV